MEDLTLYREISEASFTAQVIEQARWRGWLCHHCRPAQDRSGRWKTPIQGDPGFPDVLCLRQDRVVLAELKAMRGKVTPAQEEWLKQANRAVVESYLWKPSDILTIEEILK